MRVNIRRRIGRTKISLMIGTVTDVRGINSNLHGGGHILMWDFDEPDLAKVSHWLWTAQAFYGLPAVHISQSSEGGGYHAYCLKRVEWLQSVNIVSGTEGIDPRYVSMCCMRGHWTLRRTDKGGGTPRYVKTLPSGWPEEVQPWELVSWVDYEVWSLTRKLEPVEEK